MKTIFKKKKRFYGLTIGAATCFFLISFQASALGAPPATPIDGGLSILLLAGGAYGLKSLRDQNRQRTKN